MQNPSQQLFLYPNLHNRPIPVEPVGRCDVNTISRCLSCVRGKIMYFSFGQILNLFYRFRPSFCVLFILLLDRLSAKE